MTEAEQAQKPTRISCRVKEFPALKNRWLNQVMQDNELPGKADKLARYLVDDCSMTLHKNKGGLAYSFRGQASFAALLGVSERYMRTLFSRLIERCHLEVERGGRAHTNRTFLTLFDRNINSAQLAPLDRNSDDHMTGTYVPPSSFKGSLGGALQAPPSEIPNPDSDVELRRLDGDQSVAAREGAAPPAHRVGQQITIPVLGRGHVCKIVSRRPYILIAKHRSEDGRIIFARMQWGADGRGACRVITADEADALPTFSGETSNDQSA
ncbi:hypothetical protein [Rhizobium laguerreae]|uniref:hypothetical protein n=1 Tax=Rhizobium laguerreae TaxID=1076926 RepID=UPI001C8FAD64|nr:hypothetical protein [Rhizobium laguerreae]MBY3119946.1 hypothetical protein [Rhizobium laguerreae]